MRGRSEEGREGTLREGWGTRDEEREERNQEASASPLRC